MVSLSKPTIKSRIKLYLIFGIIVPLFVVTLVSIIAIESYIKKESYKNIENLSNSIITAIDEKFIQSQKNFNNGLTMAKYLTDNQNYDVYKSIVDLDPLFESAFLVSKNGKLMNGMVNDISIKNFIGFDLSNREFFKKVQSEQKFITTSITKSLFSNKPTITFTAPILQGDYLVVSLDLADIDVTLKKFIKKDSALYQGIISDIDGTLIFHSADFLAVEQRENISKNPLIEKLRLSNKMTLFDEFEYNGLDYLGYASTISNTNWTLSLYIEKNNIYDLIYFLRITASILLVIFLLTMVFFYKTMLHNIIQPISIFERRASLVKSGEYDLDIPDFGYKETSSLSQSFNKMSTAIKQREDQLNLLNRSLEDRIEKAKKSIQEQELIIQDQVKNRSLEQLLVDLAHQWRQPLNVCAIEIQTIEDYIEEDNKEAVIKSINNALNEIQNLSSTITKLTDFYEHGSKESISFLKGLDTSKEFLSNLLTKSHIKLDIDDCQDIPLYTTSNQWLDLFATFIYNTKEVAESRSLRDIYIKITASSNETYQEITIEDNAGGIDDRLLYNKLFEPYTTTHFKSRDKGLGLYTASKIVKHTFNGDIIATNRNNGAKFVIRIPNG
jgi:signal transduction histidine kinase